MSSRRHAHKPRHNLNRRIGESPHTKAPDRGFKDLCAGALSARFVADMDAVTLRESLIDRTTPAARRPTIGARAHRRRTRCSTACDTAGDHCRHEARIVAVVSSSACRDRGTSSTRHSESVERPIASAVGSRERCAPPAA